MLHVRHTAAADLAKRAPVMLGTLDATLVDRVTIHATMANIGMSNTLKPNVGVMFDVARNAEYGGLDLAVGGDYEFVGFNGVSALLTRAAVGADIGELRLQGNAGFGLGLEQRRALRRRSPLGPAPGRAVAVCRPRLARAHGPRAR